MNHEKDASIAVSEEDVSGNDFFQKITVAYKNLDEKGKKALFKFIQKTNPEEINKLVKIISNKIGGIRPPTIINRSSEKISNEVDAILCKGILPRFFLLVLSDFVFSERFERITWLRKNFDIYKRDPNLFKKEFYSASPDDPFNEIIYLLNDMPPSDVKESEHLEYLIVNINEKLTKLDYFSESFNQLAKKIQDAQDFDENKYEEMITEARNSIISLKKDLIKTGEEVEVNIIEWKSRKDLDDQIKMLEESINNKKYDKKALSDFLLGLSSLLKELVIENRSIILTKQYTQLRDKGSAELEKASKTKQKLKLNGPTIPSSWLEWIGNLSGKELEAEGKCLEEQDLPNLAQFIHVFDISWLIKEHKSDNVASKDKLESLNKEDLKDGKSSRETLVIQTDEKKKDDESRVEKSITEIKSIIPEKKVQKSKEDIHVEMVLQITECKISQSALQYKKNPSSENLNNLTWNLINDKELSCAYLIKTILGDNEDGIANVIEAILLSEKANIDQVEVINEIQKSYSRLNLEKLQGNINNYWLKTVNLMLFAASFQASLCSSYSNALQILSSLHLGEYQKLFQLIQHSISYAKKLPPLSSDILLQTLTDQERKQEIERLVAETNEWWSRKSTSILNYQGAIDIWKNWIKPNRPIWMLINPILIWDENKINELKTILRGIDFEKEIDVLRKDNKIKNTLVGTARKDLLKYAREAQSFAMRGIQLIEKYPQGNTNYLKNHIENFIRLFGQYSSDAISEIQHIAQDIMHPFIYRVSAKTACDSIKKIDKLIKSSRKDSIIIQPQLLTHEALLRVPEVIIDENWESRQKQHEIGDKLIDALIGEYPDAIKAFESSLNSGDLLNAQRIFDHIQIMDNLPKNELEELLQKKKTSFNEHLAKLINNFEKIDKDINEAVSKGTISYQSFLDITEVKNKIREAIDKSESEPISSFQEYRDDINSIKKMLLTDRDKSIEEIRQRMGELKLSQKDKERINATLLNGDIHLAFDFIEKIENGLDLPDEKTLLNEKKLLKCFSWGNEKEKKEWIFDSLYKKVEKTKGGELEILHNIKEGINSDDLSFEGINEEQRKEYFDVLETWFGIKRLRRIDHVSQINTIFAGFGFSVISVKKESSGDKVWIKLKTEVNIEESRPIAEYGSIYKGDYTVYCAFSSLSEEALSNVFTNASFENTAKIIFYFGPISTASRRKLASLCRRKKRTMLVIDDIMMLYLSSIKGSKIPILLELGIPFTYLVPYTTQGGVLPPEMLYGREHEIKRLQTIAPDGSCLLYGGRQIGKTVLLKHVQRITNQPQKGAIARYINLIGENIGSSNPSGLIWKVMAKSLQTEELDIFRSELPRNFDSKQFCEHVERWLLVPERRILMLLDEADTFLYDDSIQKVPFVICNELKNLMEITDRRFKVVLAGLHNVQRSTKVANNPIAHFGTPVCVGPLMNGTDSRAAQALIEEPLRYLGIFFEDPDLPIRILAQANYYPNLIQIYCCNLLNQIHERQVALNNISMPPYFIKPTDIEELYERRSLRGELRLRFDLTLNLDLRFKLIAYILAFYDNDCRDGMELEKIRETALDIWPKGFEEAATERTISREALRNLLEEMIDLGMLRCIENNKKYKLRSPNVVSLLGSKEQITEVLLDAENWEKPTQYNAETFRASITDEDRIPRSPLTAVQEGELKNRENQIYFIVGTKALESDQVGIAINKSNEKAVLIINESASFDDFVRELDDFTRKRQGQNSYVIIEDKTDWNNKWVDRARKKLEGLKLIGEKVGIIFLCNYNKLWREWEYINSLDFVKTINLQPWDESMVRYWIRDSQLQLTDRDIPEFIKTTGCWPFMISELVKYASSKPLNADVFDAFEISEFSDEAKLNELMEIFGIDIPEAYPVLVSLAEYNEFLPIEDIQELLSETEITKTEIEKTLKWADRLNLVKYKELKWKIDPIINKIINSKQLFNNKNGLV